MRKYSKWRIYAFIHVKFHFLNEKLTRFEAESNLYGRDENGEEIMEIRGQLNGKFSELHIDGNSSVLSISHI